MKSPVLQWKIALFGLLGVLVLIGVSVGTLLIRQPNESPIPKELRSQLTFSPFVISANDTTFTTSNYQLNKTAECSQMLYFVVSGFDSTVATSQCVQPSQFAEIPEYKEKFLETKQDKAVSTSNGTIYISRSPVLERIDMGIMIERGLIVYFMPQTLLTDSEWRELGDALELRRN